MKRHKLRLHWYIMTIFCIFIICLISLTWLLWMQNYRRDRSRDMFEIEVERNEQAILGYLSEFQKVAKIVSYSTTVQTYLFESKTYERLEIQNSVKDLFYQMRDSYSVIKDVAFVLPEEDVISFGGNFAGKIRRSIGDVDGIPDFNVKEPYFRYMNEQLRDIGRNIINSDYFVYVFPVYSTVAGEFRANNAVLCVLVGNLEDISDQLGSNSYFENVTMNLLAENKLLISNDVSADEKRRLISVTDGWDSLNISGKRMLTYKNNLKDTAWEMVFITNEAVSDNDLLPIQAFLLFLLISFFVAMILLMLFGIRSVSTPIHQLMNQIRKLHFDSQKSAIKILPFSNIEEIDEICRCINEMIERMEQEKNKGFQMKEELYQANLFAKQSLLQYYRSQINPHFLYNSLECIRAIAQLNHVDEICEISIALASIFRYAICENKEVPFEIELKNVSDYFKVISIRNPNQYRLCINVDEAVRNKTVQRMILQPLVENAIQHGFEGKNPPYIISIHSKITTDGLIHIGVADNGMGIPDCRLKELQENINKKHWERDDNQQVGIGLTNISHRLNLAYGDMGNLKISSKYGYYTNIELILPIAEADITILPETDENEVEN